eukprot:s4554_g4.t1
MRSNCIDAGAFGWTRAPHSGKDCGPFSADVKRLPERFKCFVAPSSEGALVVVPRPAAAWEVETLLAARYTWALLVWLLELLARFRASSRCESHFCCGKAWPLLCLLHLPGARCIPSKQFLLGFLRVTLKVCAMALVFIAVAGGVLLALRYPAARHLRDELQDGTCQLTGAVPGTRHWSLLPAVQCSVTVLKGDETAESLIFSYPTKWLDKQYHHLNCEDLVNSLDKSFPCASAGKTVLEGHKADLPVVFLELMNLQSEQPRCYWARAMPHGANSKAKPRVDPGDYRSSVDTNVDDPGLEDTPIRAFTNSPRRPEGDMNEDIFDDEVVGPHPSEAAPWQS